MSSLYVECGALSSLCFDLKTIKKYIYGGAPIVCGRRKMYNFVNKVTVFNFSGCGLKANTWQTLGKHSANTWRNYKKATKLSKTIEKL